MSTVVVIAAAGVFFTDPGQKLFNATKELVSSSQGAQGAQGAPGSSGGSGSSGSSGGSAGSGSSGIVAMSGDSSGVKFGFFDPTTGKYTPVSAFDTVGDVAPGPDGDVPQVSPDLTKFAIAKQGSGTAGNSAGWLDASGKYTAVTPAAPATTDFQQSRPPLYSGAVFDGAGNFYYTANVDGTNHGYKLAAGSTSDPQEISLPSKGGTGRSLRNPDGTLNLACGEFPGAWVGTDGRATVTTATGPTSGAAGHFVIAKFPVQQGDQGCPFINQVSPNSTKIFDLGVQDGVGNPVANPGGTKLAFYSSNTPGGLYVIDSDGNSQPVKIAEGADLNLANLRLIRWS